MGTILELGSVCDLSWLCSSSVRSAGGFGRALTAGRITHPVVQKQDCGYMWYSNTWITWDTPPLMILITRIFKQHVDSLYNIIWLPATCFLVSWANLMSYRLC